MNLPQSIIINQEFKNLIPPLSPDEKKGLESMLVSDGCREPLVIWGGTIVDGHNRYEICTRLALPYQTTEMFFEDRSAVVEWIIRNQFGRRNLQPYDRTRLVLRLEEEIKQRAKANQGARTDILSNRIESQTSVNTQQELAKLAGVGSGTIYRVKTIEEKATPEVKAELSAGTITINKAFEDIRKAEGNPVYRPVKKEVIQESNGGANMNPKKRYNGVSESVRPVANPSVLKKTNFAHQYAVMAMADLNRIQKRDPQGVSALLEVRDYINQRLEEENSK